MSSKINEIRDWKVRNSLEICQLGQLSCIRELKWNPVAKGCEGEQRRWNRVAEPGQKLSVLNLRGQHNAKNTQSPIINSIFYVAAKTKRQELTLSSKMTETPRTASTRRTRRTCRTRSDCSDSDDDKWERGGHQVKCNRGSDCGSGFGFNARDRNHRAVGRAAALDGHYPRTQASSVWHGTLAGMGLDALAEGWQLVAGWLAVGRCNCIWQRAHCGPTAAAVHL